MRVVQQNNTMMTIFKKYLQAFFGFFMSLWMGGPQKTIDTRRLMRMGLNNKKREAERRHKLKSYADRFLLPVKKRDKNGMLVHTKQTRKYERFLEKQKRVRMLRNGMKEFDIDGVNVLALNMENAIRKAN